MAHTQRIFAIPPGQDGACIAARHLMDHFSSQQRAEICVFLPNRRAAIAMRDAFLKILCGASSVLPRFIPFAQIPELLPTLVNPNALCELNQLPKAMPNAQRLYLLAAQVRAFERQRLRAISIEQSLRLATELAALQDDATRTGVPLTMERLNALMVTDVAEHWQQSLAFLTIIAQTWPLIEQELNLTTAESAYHASITWLMQQWSAHPPQHPVYVIGSTASQPLTAALMKLIASLEVGRIILPGFDPTIAQKPVEAGHPDFHAWTFLHHAGIAVGDIQPLAPAHPHAALWHQVFAKNTDWQNDSFAESAHVRIIQCQHAEEEARVIALLMRETADDPSMRTALITPDETLMQRVAAHLNRYDITVDRTASGTLAQTESGSARLCFMAAVIAPERTAPLMHFLRHPLIGGENRAQWQCWLNVFDSHCRGIRTYAPGTLPVLSAPWENHALTLMVQKAVRAMTELARTPRLRASQWCTKMQQSLEILGYTQGVGEEAVTEALQSLMMADALGAIDAEDFYALLQDILEEPWRNVTAHAHPRLYMLTPQEARLQQFDRVILGNMQASLWPGIIRQNAWLNVAQKKALGLPDAQETISLIAHDLVMLGSSREVFLTFPARDAGAPTIRSPFIEKLLAYEAYHGENSVAHRAARYVQYAQNLYRADAYIPASPPEVRPPVVMRPRSMRVTSLDALFSDPYAIYARYILELNSLEEIDSEPQAKDFGILAHRAIHQLGKYWEQHKSNAQENDLAAIVHDALRPFHKRAQLCVFWQRRLMHALRWVNAMEMLRRTSATKVHSETLLTQPLTDIPLTLRGRIDRLEQQSDFVIADYKTGKIPSKTDMLNGKAVQLMAYALLLKERGEAVRAVEYWQLPSASYEANILTLDAKDIAERIPLLRQAIALLYEPSTAFLARPFGQATRESEYDGISRYDEWAG